MTDTTQDEETQQEGVDFNDDGTITMTIKDGDQLNVYRLRTPRFGEFKTFKRQMFDAAAQVKALADEANIDMGQLALRQMTGIAPEVEKIVDASTETTMNLLREVVSTLSGKTLPENEDVWPMWMLTSDTLMSRMIDHWRTVPLGRG